MAGIEGWNQEELPWLPGYKQASSAIFRAIHPLQLALLLAWAHLGWTYRNLLRKRVGKKLVSCRKYTLLKGKNAGARRGKNFSKPWSSSLLGAAEGGTGPKLVSWQRILLIQIVLP